MIGLISVIIFVLLMGGVSNAEMSTTPKVKPPQNKSQSVFVNAKTSKQVLLSSSVVRINFIIQNMSPTGILYIRFGAGVAKDNFTYKILPLETFELNSGSILWVGEVDGMWDDPNGYAVITDIPGG